MTHLLEQRGWGAGPFGKGGDGQRLWDSCLHRGERPKPGSPRAERSRGGRQQGFESLCVSFLHVGRFLENKQKERMLSDRSALSPDVHPRFSLALNRSAELFSQVWGNSICERGWFPSWSSAPAALGGKALWGLSRQTRIVQYDA